MKQLATDSLVASAQERIETSAPSRSVATRKPGTTFATSSVSLDPMSLEQATKLTRRLLAGYPNLAAHDPEGYFAAMIAVMVEYPEWAGQRAIVKVDEENTDYPPTVPRLRKWLDDAV